jgi:hypothetical protein
MKHYYNYKSNLELNLEHELQVVNILNMLPVSNLQQQLN